MKVFKFGGASLKDSAGIRNVTSIIRSFSADTRLVVVVSAMGKTTDALERILNLQRDKKDYHAEIESLQKYHRVIMQSLFDDKGHIAFHDVDEIFLDLEKELLKLKQENFDRVYDQVVSKGEIISSRIVYHFLVHNTISTAWINACEFISTNNTFREGKVNWKETSGKIQKLKSEEHRVCITQGFIGSTSDGLTTTLGREGSDFSAAIFASCLDAESVTIWKDVPGVMSADPKRLPDSRVFEELPFKEAAEMTYYGASVIHPKTIKPLANKRIPLLVKNFENPALKGTIIHECQVKNLPPLIVFKDHQCLITCKVTDYTFVSEAQLSTIFNTLFELDVKINLMQNSAITFSFCIDFRENKVAALIERLQKYFEVYYNTGLTLITIKNYDAATFDAYRKKAGVLLEQSSRSTLQVLIKP